MAAGSISRTKIRGVATDNSVEDFGFAADNPFSTLTWHGPGSGKLGTFRKPAWREATPGDMDDFIVRVV